MGSKKSLFGGLVEKSKNNTESVDEDDLHHSSTISSLTNSKRTRSRTNILGRVANKSSNDKKLDSNYLDDIDPAECQIWHRQSRFFNLLDEQQCQDLISDFKTHIGQKIPIIIREIPDDIKKEHNNIRYEVVAGSRRLWSALYVEKHFNSKFRLKAILKKLDEKQAAIECEKENDREELSAFERGMYYFNLLEQGVFDNHRQLAESLNIPKTSLHELLEFGKLDQKVVKLFSDPREIKKSWAKLINQLFENNNSKKSLLKKVEDIGQSDLKYTPQKIFNILQKSARSAVEVPLISKFEILSKEIKDPKTKRTAIKMERTRTNKIRVSIDNKTSINKKDILKEFESFLDDCSK